MIHTAIAIAQKSQKTLSKILEGSTQLVTKKEIPYYILKDEN